MEHVVKTRVLPKQDVFRPRGRMRFVSDLLAMIDVMDQKIVIFEAGYFSILCAMPVWKLVLGQWYVVFHTDNLFDFLPYKQRECHFLPSCLLPSVGWNVVFWLQMGAQLGTNRIGRWPQLRCFRWRRCPRRDLLVVLGDDNPATPYLEEMPSNCLGWTPDIDQQTPTCKMNNVWTMFA